MKIGGSKDPYYGSVKLIWTCNSYVLNTLCEFCFLNKKITFNCEKSLDDSNPNMSVLVNACTFHKIKFLKHIFLELSYSS